MDRGAVEPRPDQPAVPPLVGALDDESLASTQHLEHPYAHGVVVFLGGEVDPRRLAVHLARAIAEHFLHAAIAAQEDAVLDEGDAHHAAIEDELLLGVCPLERLLGVPAL